MIIVKKKQIVLFCEKEPKKRLSKMKGNEERKTFLKV